MAGSSAPFGEDQGLVSRFTPSEAGPVSAAPEEHLHLPLPGPPKRTRIQLSCTHCRTGKLKCDRQVPCHQCIKRGRESQCNIPAHSTRKKQPASMQSRLRHLESLVRDVMTGQTSTASHSNLAKENGDANTGSSTCPGPRMESTNQPDMGVLPGIYSSDDATLPSELVVQGQRETAYIGATHWAAILDDIEEVKSYFYENEEDESLVEDDARPDTSMVFQLQNPTTAEQLIAALPGRPIVDKLVSGYFKGCIPSQHLIHRPTFQKQYKDFWDNPATTPLAWIALLYALMTHATLASLGAGEENLDGRGSHMEMITAYRTWCSQCLVLSNYTHPGPYSITALLIYLEGELALSKHDQINCYVLVGVAVRLSLKIGLHRDATKIAGNISPFQAELRRRLWHFLVQVDLLVSFHIGLPGMVQAIESDAEHPRNLRDEDFNENSTDLPAGRPESEMTPMSYILCKGRICRVFGQIAVQVNHISPPPYSEVLHLDKTLTQAFTEVPMRFQVVPLELAITDSVDIIIQRFSIAVLYYKSRCVLHRKYLIREKHNPQFAFSVKAGLDASVQLLRFQSSIHDAVQPNNLLSRETWFISSLAIHDFLLAATILYLILAQAIKATEGRNIQNVLEKHHELITLLERSRDVWNETRSSEGKNASEILQKMIEKIKLAVRPGTSADTKTLSGASKISHLSLNDSSHLTGVSNYHIQGTEGIDACSTGISQATMTPSLDLLCNSPISNSGDPIANMLDMPMNFDWDTFDNLFRSQTVPEKPQTEFQLLDFEMESFADSHIL